MPIIHHSLFFTPPSQLHSPSASSFFYPSSRSPSTSPSTAKQKKQRPRASDLNSFSHPQRLVCRLFLSPFSCLSPPFSLFRYLSHWVGTLFCSTPDLFDLFDHFNLLCPLIFFLQILLLLFLFPCVKFFFYFYIFFFQCIPFSILIYCPLILHTPFSSYTSLNG